MYPSMYLSAWRLSQVNILPYSFNQYVALSQSPFRSSSRKLPRIGIGFGPGGSECLGFSKTMTKKRIAPSAPPITMASMVDSQDECLQRCVKVAILIPVINQYVQRDADGNAWQNLGECCLNKVIVHGVVVIAKDRDASFPQLYCIQDGDFEEIDNHTVAEFSSAKARIEEPESMWLFSSKCHTV